MEIHNCLWQATLTVLRALQEGTPSWELDKVVATEGEDVWLIPGVRTEPTESEILAWSDQEAWIRLERLDSMTVALVYYEDALSREKRFIAVAYRSRPDRSLFLVCPAPSHEGYEVLEKYHFHPSDTGTDLKALIESAFDRTEVEATV